MRIFVPLLLTAATVACGPALYTQNIGLAYRVKRGASAEDVRKIMGEPALTRSIDGVDEWRYCATAPGTDEVAVIYFHKGVVLDRAYYSMHPAGEWGRPSCLDNIDFPYSSDRRPPRRVVQARQGRGAIH